MQEIKAILFRYDQLVIMNKAGNFFACPARPGIRRDRSASRLPKYDEQTNCFVCGSDAARAGLRELLTHVLVASEQPIPAFVMNCPLLGSEVAAQERDWRTFAASHGLNGETLSVVAA